MHQPSSLSKSILEREGVRLGLSGGRLATRRRCRRRASRCAGSSSNKRVPRYCLLRHGARRKDYPCYLCHASKWRVVVWSANANLLNAASRLRAETAFADSAAGVGLWGRVPINFCRFHRGLETARRSWVVPLVHLCYFANYAWRSARSHHGGDATPCGPLTPDGAPSQPP